MSKDTQTFPSSIDTYQWVCENRNVRLMSRKGVEAVIVEGLNEFKMYIAGYEPPPVQDLILALKICEAYALQVVQDRKKQDREKMNMVQDVPEEEDYCRVDLSEAKKVEQKQERSDRFSGLELD